jgi:hypothetical protein
MHADIKVYIAVDGYMASPYGAHNNEHEVRNISPQRGLD